MNASTYRRESAHDLGASRHRNRDHLATAETLSLWSHQESWAAKTRSTAITAGGEHGVSEARDGGSEIKALRAIWRPASMA